MCYYPPWAGSPLQQLSDALFHRRSPYHYNVDGCRRDRFVRPFLLSWDRDGFPAPLELSSKRDTTSIRDIAVSRTIIRQETIHTVSSARLSSHVSTSNVIFSSWFSGASQETASFCKKSFSLSLSVCSCQSTWSFLSRYDSNVSRQKGQTSGLKASRHLCYMILLISSRWGIW